MFTAQELRKKWLLDRLLTYELYVGSPGRGCEKGRRYHQEIANLKMETSEDYYQYDDEMMMMMMIMMMKHYIEWLYP